MKRGYTKSLICAAFNIKAKPEKRAQGSKKEITIETHKVFVVRRRSSYAGWCPGCAETVEMVKPEEAAAFLQISLRRVFRRVEAESLHSAETADGALFVCHNSLMNAGNEVVKNENQNNND
jgi:hypothetical protein